MIAADYSSVVSGNFIASLVELNVAMREKGYGMFFCFPKTVNTVSKSTWVRWLEREDGKVYLMDMNQSTDKQLQSLREIIEKNSIDILHLHFGMFYQFATHFRKELPVKIIIHEHMEYPVGCNKTKQTIKYLIRSVKYRINNITFVSVNKQMFLAHPLCKRIYIPNGLSTKRNTIRSLSREELRERLCITNDVKVVLFLGWDYHRKGLDIAIKAVNEHRNRSNNSILGIIGLDLNDETVKKYINENTGITTNEPWILDLHGGEDMFAFHRAADVYLSASRSEAFSYGILEAISQNTPVVVSDIKGTNWSWEYSKTYTYPVDDHVKCADAIEKALAIGRKESNYVDICDKYSIERWCEKVIQIYEKI